MNDKDKIWLSSPHMGGKELDYIHDAFKENWIAPIGPNVNGFEHDIVNFTKAGNAAALSTGTASIHLGLVLLGVEAGDEVICQSMTFAASANPITYLGATPVFVDSEERTWNMSPALLEEAIKDRLKKTDKKPKAIIPVHLYGMPANMPEIMKIANKYEIPVLEDAAESLGSKINGKMTGTFGELGALSFNGNKIITTSGGGALISDQKKHIDRARFLATQARDDAPHYQHTNIGYNYRMSNITAGIGRGQMQVLNKRIKQRRAVYNFYEEELREFDCVQFLNEPNGYFSNRWLTTLLIDSGKNDGVNRKDIRKALVAENIDCRPLWKPMHMQPIFKGAPSYTNGVSEKHFKNGLCMPSGSNLEEFHLDKIIKIIKATVR